MSLARHRSRRSRRHPQSKARNSAQSYTPARATRCICPPRWRWSSAAWCRQRAPTVPAKSFSPFGVLWFLCSNLPPLIMQSKLCKQDNIANEKCQANFAKFLNEDEDLWTELFTVKRGFFRLEISDSMRESWKKPVIIGKIGCWSCLEYPLLNEKITDFYKRAIRPKQTVYRK